MVDPEELPLVAAVVVAVAVAVAAVTEVLEVLIMFVALLLDYIEVDPEVLPLLALLVDHIVVAFDFEVLPLVALLVDHIVVEPDQLIPVDFESIVVVPTFSVSCDANCELFLRPSPGRTLSASGC